LHLGSLKNRTLASRQRTPQSTQHLLRKCQMTRQQEHRLHHLAADARRYPLASPQSGSPRPCSPAGMKRLNLFLLTFALASCGDSHLKQPNQQP
jgi:hypothetical protein